MLRPYWTRPSSSADLAPNAGNTVAFAASDLRTMPASCSATVHQHPHSNKLKNSFVVVEPMRDRERPKRSFDAQSCEEPNI